MPSLDTLTRPWVVEATLDVQDEQVVFSYDRNMLTTRLLADAQASDDVLLLARLLAEILVGWDVTDNDGDPYPPTIENLAALPLDLLRQLLLEISAVPTRAEGNASSGRSSTPPSASTPPPPTSPNGPAASSSLESSMFPSPP